MHSWTPKFNLFKPQIPPSSIKIIFKIPVCGSALAAAIDPKLGCAILKNRKSILPRSIFPRRLPWPQKTKFVSVITTGVQL